MNNSKNKKTPIKDRKIRVLSAKLRIDLRNDIIKRYDNGNYWSRKLVDDFCLEHGITETGKTELLSNLL